MAFSCATALAQRCPQNSAICRASPSTLQTAGKGCSTQTVGTPHKHPVAQLRSYFCTFLWGRDTFLFLQCLIHNWYIDHLVACKISCVLIYGFCSKQVIDFSDIREGMHLSCNAADRWWPGIFSQEAQRLVRIPRISSKSSAFSNLCIECIYFWVKQRVCGPQRQNHPSPITNWIHAEKGLT